MQVGWWGPLWTLMIDIFPEFMQLTGCCAMDKSAGVCHGGASAALVELTEMK